MNDAPVKHVFEMLAWREPRLECLGPFVKETPKQIVIRRKGFRGQEYDRRINKADNIFVVECSDPGSIAAAFESVAQEHAGKIRQLRAAVDEAQTQLRDARAAQRADAIAAAVAAGRPSL